MKRNIIAIALVVTLFGCNSNKSADYASDSKEVMAEPVSADTAAAKIIKTADMRFRVKDVQNTKEQLSQTIKSQGGAIAEFSIQSSIQESDKVKYSTDSLKEITSYRKDGFLVAKIPSEKLDDFTNTVAKMAVFVDTESMKMDDQSITYLANKMKAQNRVDASNQINKIPTKKAGNIETSLSLKDEYVDKKIDNMSIDSRVRYSTITLNFYQDNTVKTMIVANDNLYDYRPGFINRLGLNLLNGWTIFKEIILAIANAWTILVLCVAVFLGIKYYKAKRV